MGAGKTRQLVLAVWCAAFAMSALLAGCSKPAAPTLKESKFRFAILKDGVALNNKQTRFPVSHAALVKMIGKPSRTKKGENLIHTWDELGILAYQPPDSKQVSEIHFCFKPDSSLPFSPKKPFAELSMNGTTLTADSSSDDVSAAGFKKGDLFMKATTGSVQSLCTFNDFGVPGQRQAGLIEISCSKAEKADKASNNPESKSVSKKGRQGGPKTMDEMLLESYMKDLESDSDDLKCRAARGLATLGDKAKPALPSLTNLLTSPSPTVSSAAKATIASIKRGDASGDNIRDKLVRRDPGASEKRFNATAYAHALAKQTAPQVAATVLDEWDRADLAATAQGAVTAIRPSEAEVLARCREVLEERYLQVFKPVEGQPEASVGDDPQIHAQIKKATINAGLLLISEF